MTNVEVDQPDQVVEMVEMTEQTPINGGSKFLNEVYRKAGSRFAGCTAWTCAPSVNGSQHKGSGKARQSSETRRDGEDLSKRLRVKTMAEGRAPNIRGTSIGNERYIARPCGRKRGSPTPHQGLTMTVPHQPFGTL
jgi:hypothetical protein